MRSKTEGEHWTVHRNTGAPPNYDPESRGVSGGVAEPYYQIEKNFVLSVGGKKYLSSGIWEEEVLGNVGDWPYFIERDENLDNLWICPRVTNYDESVLPTGFSKWYWNLGRPDKNEFYAVNGQHRTITLSDWNSDEAFSVSAFEVTTGHWHTDAGITANSFDVLGHIKLQTSFTLAAKIGFTLNVTRDSDSNVQYRTSILTSAAPGYRQYSYIDGGSSETHDFFGASYGYKFGRSHIFKDMWIWRCHAVEEVDHDVRRGVLVFPNPAANGCLEDLNGPFISIPSILFERNYGYFDGTTLHFPDKRDIQLDYFFTSVTIGDIAPADLFNIDPFYSSDPIECADDWRWKSVEADLSEGGFDDPPHEDYMYVIVRFEDDLTHAGNWTYGSQYLMDAAGSPNLWAIGDSVDQHYWPPHDPWGVGQEVYSDDGTKQRMSGGYAMGFSKNGDGITVAGAIDEEGYFNTAEKYYMSPEPI